MRRAGWLLLLAGALALHGCGREREGAEPPAAPEARPEAPPPAAVPAAEAAAAPEPMDSAAVARALAEDDRLEAENRASYERRRRSMSSYEECMAQARDIPQPSRGRVEAACAAGREAP